MVLIDEGYHVLMALNDSLRATGPRNECRIRVMSEGRVGQRDVASLMV